MLIILLVILAGCQTKDDISTYRKLQVLDSEFVHNNYYYYEPSALSTDVNEYSKFIDSLKSIDEATLSKRNKAYYCLLKTVASFNKTIDSPIFINDGIIDYSINYYKNRKDRHNELRCLLTKGILKYHNKKDSSGFEALRECEKKFDTYKISDSSLLASIYLSTARCYRINRNLNPALVYIDKSYKIYDRLGLKREATLSRIEKASLLFALNKNSQALSILDSLSSEKCDLDAKRIIYSRYITYYSSIGNNKKIIEYTRKKSMVDVLKNGLSCLDNYYLKYSIIYRQTGQLDSALYYAKLSVSIDSTSSSGYLFSNYNSLANIYEDMGNYKLSSEYYSKAFDNYRDFIVNKKIKELQEKKDKEIQKIFNESVSDEKRLREINRLVIVVSVLAIIIVCTVFTFIFLLHNVMNNKKKAEEKFENAQVIQQVLSTTIGLLPEITTELSKVVNQSAKYSSEIFDLLNNILNNFKIKFRSNITNIVSSNSFQKQNSTINSISELSNQEKLITSLYEKEYTSNQIADFLGLSQGSIRACKSRIKLKLHEKYSPIPKEIRSLKIMKEKK